MFLNIDVIRQIREMRELEELNHSLSDSYIGVITPEELERIEEEREDMLRWLPFNKAEDEQT